MERIPIDVIKDTTDAALRVGEFVVERLLGGAWARLADIVYSEETHQATLAHMENIVRGEE